MVQKNEEHFENGTVPIDTFWSNFKDSEEDILSANVKFCVFIMPLSVTAKAAASKPIETTVAIKPAFEQEVNTVVNEQLKLITCPESFKDLEVWRHYATTNEFFRKKRDVLNEFCNQKKISVGRKEKKGGVQWVILANSFVGKKI